MTLKQNTKHLKKKNKCSLCKRDINRLESFMSDYTIKEICDDCSDDIFEQSILDETWGEC